MHTISTKFFQQRSLTELQVFSIKVKRNSNLNELLYEHLADLLDKSEPEIYFDPQLIRYVRDGIFRHLYFDDHSLTLYPPEEVIRMEIYLRTSGFANEAKIKVANMIQAFLLKHVSYYRGRIMIAQDLLPDQPIRPRKDEDTIRFKWNYQICVQEIEFHGKDLLTRLRHVEASERHVDTEMEEGEISGDQGTTAPQ